MSLTLDPRRAALLLVDLQRDQLHENGAYAHRGMRAMSSAEAADMIERCQALADAMRAVGRPVVFASTAFRRDYMDAGVARAWLEPRIGDGPFLVEGTWGADFMDGLERDESDYSLVKKAHGAFLGTPLDRLLTNLGVDEVILAGGGVGDSIAETVRTGGMFGYTTFVVEDALYPPHSPDLDVLRKNAEWTSTAEVLASAGAPATNPPPGLRDEQGAGAAVVIVDMQNDFLSPERPSVRYGGSSAYPEEKRERMIHNTRELAGAVRARGWPVVYVKVARRADNLDDVHAKTFRVTRALPKFVTHAAQGTWGAEIVSELTPEPNDFVIEKKGASGFGFTPLHRLLRNLGIRRCLVTGGATTGCVRATVFDGLALGYDVTVIADATYPPDSAHLDVLARWCSIRPTAEVLDELSSTGQPR